MIFFCSCFVLLWGARYFLLFCLFFPLVFLSFLFVCFLVCVCFCFVVVVVIIVLAVVVWGEG